MTVGDRIQKACDAQAVTPAELARRIGKTRQYVSAILSGERSGDTMLRAIAEALQVEVTWLTTGHDAVAPAWAKSRENTSEREKRLQIVIDQLSQDISQLKEKDAQAREEIERLLKKKPPAEKQR